MFSVNQFSLSLTHSGLDSIIWPSWVDFDCWTSKWDMTWKNLSLFIWTWNCFKCELCLPIWFDIFFGKLIQPFYSLLKVIWASSLPPSLFFVMYFLAWAELNSKYLVDIVTGQIKAQQQNNEMISADGYSLRRPVSLICWDAVRVTRHVTHLKEFKAVCVHKFYIFIKHKSICIVYSIIRPFREECWRDIGGETSILWVVLGLLVSQSKHQSDVGTLLNSFYTVKAQCG